jgi:hypothetical protein
MKKFRLVTPVNNTGYGIVGLSLVKALHDIGAEFELEVIGPVGTGFEFSPACSFFYPALSHSLNYRKPVDQALDRFVFWHMPQARDYCSYNPSVRNVIYTTFELEQLTVERFDVPENTFITTTTEHGLSILKQHTENVLDVPIPHAFWHDKDVCFLENLPRIQEYIDPTKFWREALNLDPKYVLDRVVSTCGKAEERKSTKEIIDLVQTSCYNTLLVASCYNMFNPGAFPALLIYSGFKIEKVLPFGVLFTKDSTHTKVLSLKHTDKREEIYKLLAISDLYISLSKGEGWNLPLFDMYSIGVPTLFSNIPVHEEIYDIYTELNTYNAVSVEINPLQPAFDGVFFNSEGKWHPPNMEHAARVYENCLMDSHNHRNKRISRMKDLTWISVARKVVSSMNS